MCSVRISHVPSHSQQFSLSEMLKCDQFVVANLLVTDKTHSGQVHIRICAPSKIFPAAPNTTIEKQLALNYSLDQFQLWVLSFSKIFSNSFMTLCKLCSPLQLWGLKHGAEALSVHMKI